MISKSTSYDCPSKVGFLTELIVKVNDYFLLTVEAKTVVKVMVPPELAAIHVYEVERPSMMHEDVLIT